MAQKPYRSEDELGLKFDRCFADTLLKVAGGVAIGVVASVALFKGRTAPAWLGAGIGFGAGWENCRHSLANMKCKGSISVEQGQTLKSHQ